MIKKNYILIFLFSTICFSQQDFVSTGGDAESNSGSFSYSIGQILVFEMKSSKDTWSEEALSLNHGVQQVFTANCTNSEKNSNFCIPKSVNRIGKYGIFKLG